jgi:hypothetical protein
VGIPTDPRLRQNLKRVRVPDRLLFSPPTGGGRALARARPEKQQGRRSDLSKVLTSSHDLTRRHLNKGQQAVALALAYPAASGRGKIDPARKQSESGSFSSDLAEAMAYPVEKFNWRR